MLYYVMVFATGMVAGAVALFVWMMRQAESINAESVDRGVIKLNGVIYRLDELGASETAEEISKQDAKGQ